MRTIQLAISVTISLVFFVVIYAATFSMINNSSVNSIEITDFVIHNTSYGLVVVWETNNPGDSRIHYSNNTYYNIQKQSNFKTKHRFLLQDISGDVIINISSCDLRNSCDNKNDILITNVIQPKEKCILSDFYCAMVEDLRIPNTENSVEHPFIIYNSLNCRGIGFEYEIKNPSNTYVIPETYPLDGSLLIDNITITDSEVGDWNITIQTEDGSSCFSSFKVSKQPNCDLTDSDCASFYPSVIAKESSSTLTIFWEPSCDGVEIEYTIKHQGSEPEKTGTETFTAGNNITKEINFGVWDVGFWDLKIETNTGTSCSISEAIEVSDAFFRLVVVPINYNFPSQELEYQEHAQKFFDHWIANSPFRESATPRAKLLLLDDVCSTAQCRGTAIGDAKLCEPDCYDGIIQCAQEKYGADFDKAQGIYYGNANNYVYIGGVLGRVTGCAGNSNLGISPHLGSALGGAVHEYPTGFNDGGASVHELGHDFGLCHTLDTVTGNPARPVAPKTCPNNDTQPYGGNYIMNYGIMETFGDESYDHLKNHLYLSDYLD